MNNNQKILQSQLPNEPKYVPKRAKDWAHSDPAVRYENLPKEYKKRADDFAVRFKGNHEAYCRAMNWLYDQCDYDRRSAKQACSLSVLAGFVICVVFLAFVKLSNVMNKESRNITEFKKIENVVRHR